MVIIERMSLYELALNYKNEHNRIKYTALNELQTSEDIDSVHYNILKENAKTTALEVRQILQRQPVEVITIFGPETVNEADEMALGKFMISLASYMDLIQLEMTTQKNAYRMYTEQIESLEIDVNNILASITNRGLLTAVRNIAKGTITRLNGIRTAFKDSFKNEIRYLFKCIFHTWKAKAIDNLVGLNLIDFLDFCCKYYVLDKPMMENLYSIMLDLDSVSNTTYTNMYDMMMTMNTVDCINTDHIFDIIFSCYKEYKTTPSDDSNILNILNLLHTLDTVTSTEALDLEEFETDNVIKAIMICLDVYKYLNSNTKRVVEVIFSPISVICSIMVKLLEVEEFILYSFLVYYIPYTLLTCPPSMSDVCSSFINVFKILSTRNKFFQYMGSFMTQDMKPLIELIFDGNNKAIKKIDMKAGMYEIASEMDTDSIFKDELTGCMIVCPGLLRVGERDIWLDGYAFMSYLYQKPENPYTRESLTPEEFFESQKGYKDEIRRYKKDRKEFLLKVLEDE